MYANSLVIRNGESLAIIRGQRQSEHEEEYNYD